MGYKNLQTTSKNDVPIGDEFDTSANETEHAALSAELEQSREAIDKGFAEFMATNMPPEIEELFFAEDKTQFFLEVERLKEEFVNEKLTPTFNRLIDLEKSIKEKTLKRSERDTEREFLKTHPDADIKVLYEYLENDISPREQARIKAMSRLDGLNEIYKLMNKDKMDGGELPEQINGNFNDDASSDYNDLDLPISRY